MDITKQVQHLTWDAIDTQNKKNRAEKDLEDTKQGQVGGPILRIQHQGTSGGVSSGASTSKQVPASGNKTEMQDKLIDAQAGQKRNIGATSTAKQQAVNAAVGDLKKPDLKSVEKFSFKEFRKSDRTASLSERRSKSEPEIRENINSKNLQHDVKINNSRSLFGDDNVTVKTTEKFFFPRKLNPPENAFNGLESETRFNKKNIEEAVKGLQSHSDGSKARPNAGGFQKPPTKLSERRSAAVQAAEKILWDPTTTVKHIDRTKPGVTANNLAQGKIMDYRAENGQGVRFAENRSGNDEARTFVGFLNPQNTSRKK